MFVAGWLDLSKVGAEFSRMAILESVRRISLHPWAICKAKGGLQLKQLVIH